MGATRADKAGVLMLMENIHSRLDACSVNVKIMLRSGKQSVVAGAKVEKNAMMLPPCITKNMKVLDATNEHPMAVPISMALADIKNTQGPGDKNSERTVNFLLCHDFKAPTELAASSSLSS